ncbi:MAG: hypothetical protein VB835_09895, partial [Pirellulales bacterium]
AGAVAGTANHTVAAAQSLATVADRLRDGLQANLAAQPGYTVTSSGETVAVARTDASSFSVRLTGVASTADVGLRGTRMVDQNWRLELLDDRGALVASGEHTVSPVAGGGPESFSTVATGLVAGLQGNLPAGYALHADDGRVVGVRADGGGFTLRQVDLSSGLGFDVEAAVPSVVAGNTNVRIADGEFHLLGYAVTRQYRPSAPAEIAAGGDNTQQTISFSGATTAAGYGDDSWFSGNAGSGRIYYGQQSVSVNDSMNAAQVAALLSGLDALRDLQIAGTGAAGTDANPWTFTLAAAETGAAVTIERLQFAGVETVSGPQQAATAVDNGNRVQSLVADRGPFTVFYGDTGADVVMAATVPTAAEVKAAVEALPTVGRVEVGGAGSSADPWRVVLVEADKADGRYLALRAERYVDSAGGAVQSTTPFSAGISEVQRLNLGGATGGTFSLRRGSGAAVDVSIGGRDAATANRIQTQLRVAGGNDVDVTVSAAGVYDITFGGFNDEEELVLGGTEGPVGTTSVPAVRTRTAGRQPVPFSRVARTAEVADLRLFFENWQDHAAIKYGPQEIQRIRLGGESGSQVTGSFALSYNGSPPVTVLVGGDNISTAGNIQAALNGISAAVDVTVVDIGRGQFDVKFNAPTATNIDELVFSDVDLVGAAAAGVSTITDGTAAAGETVTVTSAMTPVDVAAALESLPFIGDVCVGGAGTFADPWHVVMRTADRDSNGDPHALLREVSVQRMTRPLDVAVTSNPSEQRIPQDDILQDTQLFYAAGSRTLGASDIAADKNVQATKLQAALNEMGGLENVTVAYNAVEDRYEIRFPADIANPLPITYFNATDGGQAVPGELVSGTLSLPLDLPGLTLKHGAGSIFVDLTSRVRRLNLAGEAVGAEFNLQYGIAPAVSFTVGADDAATRANIATALTGVGDVTVTVAGAGWFDVTYGDSVANVDLLLQPAGAAADAARIPTGRGAEIAAALGTLLGGGHTVQVQGSGGQGDRWTIAVGQYNRQQPLVVEYQLDGLAPLATNAAASWQVIERLTGGDHQVQRVNLTAASGDVTGSFTLEYDENQVTVNLGADDEATRSNIENALEGIANPQLDVAVAPAGAGVFDIQFLKPAAADVLEL